MNREHLVKDIVDRLVRLPSPFDSHYGVVPLPPSEEYIILGEIAQAHQEALNSIIKIDSLVEELHDPYIVSRILSRQEAVNSSKIEGTNSTLNELLSLEEGEDKPNARPVIAYAKRGWDLFAKPSSLAWRSPTFILKRSTLSRMEMEEQDDCSFHF